MSNKTKPPNPPKLRLIYDDDKLQRDAVMLQQQALNEAIAMLNHLSNHQPKIARLYKPGYAKLGGLMNQMEPLKEEILLRKKERDEQEAKEKKDDA